MKSVLMFVYLWIVVSGDSFLLGQSSEVTGTEFLRRGSLRPGLREAARVLGDRLEKPGKERVQLLGTITRGSNAAVPFQLWWQFPGRLRTEETSGQTKTTLVFDGSSLRKSAGTPDAADRQLVETFLEDTPEGLLIGQLRGFATRLLGNRFRMSGATSRNYQGPYYEVYEVSRPLADRQTVGRIRYYYLNAFSSLVERVKYEIGRTPDRVRVEVHLSQWGETNGQRFPGRIIRTENGQPVLNIQFTSALVGPAQGDDVFSNP